MTKLRVIEGGRDYDVTVSVRRDEFESLRIENLTARAERLAFTIAVRKQVRKMMEEVGERNAYLGLLLDQTEQANERESLRAMSMAPPPRLSCDRCGARHEPDDACAVSQPVRRVA